MDKSAENILKTIRKIKAGNDILRNDFIEQYKSFIMSTISKTTGRYIDTENCEELSIGLLAFNEAIDRYESKKGTFIHFAEVVIRSRIIDFVKRENKHKNDCLEDNKEILSYTESKFERVELREEINHFKKSLEQYGFSMKDLVQGAPKHYDTKKNASIIANKILNHPVLLSEFEKRKKIPIKASAQYCGVSEKVIKRNKIYITAYILILKGPGESLKEFLSIRGGGVDGA